MQICYQRSNILLLVFFLNRFGYGKINIASPIPKTPTQIVVTAIHSARTAFAGHIFMSVGGFDDLAAELALNGVFDDFSHNIYLLSAQNNIT